ncbi:hypothetical protein, partial [Photorhabdus sp. RW14-46]|uniref:hypothetical protein n=1 Tax=Photorhabdus sp. RW14-46 TaxID=2100168 RepID=UPI001A980EE8|nr:hypothetical protein [Photorhabdus sp. RW14-46]
KARRGKKSGGDKMVAMLPCESHALRGLALPNGYDCLGDDAPSVGSMKTRKAGYTIIVLGITITRSGNTSVPIL